MGRCGDGGWEDMRRGVGRCEEGEWEDVRRVERCEVEGG